MTTADSIDPADVLVIRNPELDSSAIEEQIRRNMVNRRELPPVYAMMGNTKMAAERRQIVASVHELKRRVRDCGLVATHRPGWKGKIELWVKKSLRRLVFRHLLQQHRVHLKLMSVLDQMVDYLEEQDRCLRMCLDGTERHFQGEFDALSRNGPRKADNSRVASGDPGLTPRAGRTAPLEPECGPVHTATSLAAATDYGLRTTD
jgi:hypothetical protein